MSDERETQLVRQVDGLRAVLVAEHRAKVDAEARITVLEDALREALEASSRGPLFGSDMERWSRVLRGEPPPAPEKP